MMEVIKLIRDPFSAGFQRRTFGCIVKKNIYFFPFFMRNKNPVRISFFYFSSERKINLPAFELYGDIIGPSVVGWKFLPMTIVSDLISWRGAHRWLSSLKMSSIATTLCVLVDYLVARHQEHLAKKM